MTSTTDTTQHPDVSEISDLTEGLLAPSRAAEVQEHLDGCALCADVRASLEEIRGLLGTLPGPPRMPAELAGRIDAALAAEALLAATAPDDTGTGSGTDADDAPTDADADPADVSRETSAPAPSSDVSPDASGEGAAASDPVRTDRPAGRPRAATGPGRSARSRRRRRTTVLGALFGTAAVGVSVFLLHSIATSSPGAKSADSASAAKSATVGPQVISEGDLRERVDALLAADPSASSGASPRTSSGQKSLRPQQDNPGADERTTNTPLMQSVPPVPACIQLGTGRTDPVLAVDQGVYQGSSAYLVVLPDPGDSTRVQAYVIDAACVDTAPTGKGTVLLTHSYPRH
ncbi:zf-HC2 domain-containing protein [Streptomyces sp. NPDC006638]|uniref:anti-sigma factor family protein n=1 Tax=Streptomyces sp. NPDC006638 TaxID=3157183 RepID=UPI0033A10684